MGGDHGAVGHGKSTLLQLLGGLDRPSAGPFDGAELGTLGAAELRRCVGRSIGFVFQFFNLLPHLTALENVEIALWLGGAAKRNGTRPGSARTRGPGRQGPPPAGMLSGGQQQRVAIARALANEPDILLMDEPTGNLDSAAEAELLGVLDGLHQAGKTLLMVTHNPAVAARAGRILGQGRPDRRGFGQWVGLADLGAGCIGRC